VGMTRERNSQKCTKKQRKKETRERPNRKKVSQRTVQKKGPGKLGAIDNDQEKKETRLHNDRGNPQSEGGVKLGP